ncbi:MAG: hypothetical protein IBJ00_07735 [Alphaproteobacteria bacterium]|nr:hypothetical protein [Alphaproteobacteria bacterium]
MKRKTIFLGVILSFFVNKSVLSSCEIEDRRERTNKLLSRFSQGKHPQDEETPGSVRIIGSTPRTTNTDSVLVMRYIEYNDLLRLLKQEKIEIQGRQVVLMSTDEAEIKKINDFLRKNPTTKAIVTNDNTDYKKAGFGAKRKLPSSATYKLISQQKIIPDYHIKIRFN